jgi:hypothetical protein
MTTTQWPFQPIMAFVRTTTWVQLARIVIIQSLFTPHSAGSAYPCKMALEASMYLALAVISSATTISAQT